MIATAYEAKKKAGTTPALDECGYPPTFSSEKRLTIEDVSLVCELFYKVVEENKIPKDKLLEWLQEAWDRGVHQQRVCSMEVEGGILNQFGIVSNFGADLVMFGERKNLIPA